MDRVLIFVDSYTVTKKVYIFKVVFLKWLRLTSFSQYILFGIVKCVYFFQLNVFRSFSILIFNCDGLSARKMHTPSPSPSSPS